MWLLMKIHHPLRVSNSNGVNSNRNGAYMFPDETRFKLQRSKF